eukprot:scaffold8126_cov170-Amphora_coffeaeformis.AAC.11
MGRMPLAMNCTERRRWAISLDRGKGLFTAPFVQQDKQRNEIIVGGKFVTAKLLCIFFQELLNGWKFPIINDLNNPNDVDIVVIVFVVRFVSKVDAR